MLTTESAGAASVAGTHLMFRRRTKHATECAKSAEGSIERDGPIEASHGVLVVVDMQRRTGVDAGLKNAEHPAGGVL